MICIAVRPFVQPCFCSYLCRRFRLSKLDHDFEQPEAVAYRNGTSQRDMVDHLTHTPRKHFRSFFFRLHVVWHFELFLRSAWLLRCCSEWFVVWAIFYPVRLPFLSLVPWKDRKWDHSDWYSPFPTEIRWPFWPTAWDWYSYLPLCIIICPLPSFNTTWSLLLYQGPRNNNGGRLFQKSA